MVAAEIRRLADSVTDSTGEIESKVSEIQDSISRLVITSEKGASGIIEGMEATTPTADRLNELVDAASKTASAAATDLAVDAQQQKTAVSQVIALREIVGATHHTAQSMSQLSDVSRNMAGLSSDMDSQVSRSPRPRRLSRPPWPSAFCWLMTAPVRGCCAPFSPRTMPSRSRAKRPTASKLWLRSGASAPD